MKFFCFFLFTKRRRFLLLRRERRCRIQPQRFRQPVQTSGDGLAGEDAARMQKLLDVLEDLDDVQAVYHNAHIDSEAL